MNGIERHFGVLRTHAKQLQLTFTLSIILMLFALGCIGTLSNVAHAQEDEDIAAPPPPPPSASMQLRQAPQNQSTATPAPAPQTTNTAPTPLPPRQNTTPNPVRETVQEVRSAALSDRRQQRVRNLAANISNRLDATTDRMNSIVGRIDSRIEKLVAQGIDTTAAEEHVMVARTELDSATVALADIDVTVGNAITSEKPREAWQNAREAYQTARTHLVNARASLRSAITALKEAVTAAETGTGVSDAVQNENSDSEASATDPVDEEAILD